MICRFDIAQNALSLLWILFTYILQQHLFFYLPYFHVSNSDILTLHGYPSEMDENFMLNNSKLTSDSVDLATLSIKFEFICEGQIMLGVY